MSSDILPPPLSSGRLIIVGASGLVGGAMAREAAARGLQVVPVGRGQSVADVVGAGDVVINCALDPAYKTGPYDPTVDLERQSAEAALRAGARVVMLSTRKVYQPEVQWGARETDATLTEGQGYGPNKARTEAWLLDAAQGDRALIVRLSNVFGFEFVSGAPPRPSFFGQMLYRLKTQGEILFDMSPATRRDFVATEAVATAIVDAILKDASGVYNLGAGAAVACSDIAHAVISGYGDGRLRGADAIRDEFFLDGRKWNSEIGPVDARSDLLTVVTTHGERLRYA
jgi:nucleoside-diphosphate-sugar epimerase